MFSFLCHDKNENDFLPQNARVQSSPGLNDAIGAISRPDIVVNNLSFDGADEDNDDVEDDEDAFGCMRPTWRPPSIGMSTPVT